MATKQQRNSVKGLKNLTAKKLAAKEASRVKAGYIGETEKLKGGPREAGVTSLLLPAVQKVRE